MSASDNYRTHAADCLRLARTSQDVYTRLALLSMAQSWVRLAEQAAAKSGEPHPAPGLLQAS
jgi:hypothetical protein